MLFSRHILIAAVVVVVSLPVRSAIEKAPTGAGERANDPMLFMSAGGRSCEHPLFLSPTYAAGHMPRSVAVGDLDGVNGPDLAVSNLDSNDVSVLLNQERRDLRRGGGVPRRRLPAVGGCQRPGWRQRPRSRRGERRQR